jgi:predicted dehydrogenase
MGEVRQDLHTWPAKKEAVAVFEKGSLVWSMGDESDSVAHRDAAGAEIRMWNFPKTRPDDFIGELQHVQDLLNDPSLSSPLDLQNSLDVMDVIFSALESSLSGTRVPLSVAPER